MKLITTRDRILSVATRWKQQDPRDKDGVQAKLDRLDLTVATASHINAIIGNDSWTTMICDECCDRVDAVVEVVPGSGWDNQTSSLCKSCATKALSLFTTNQP